MAMRLISCPSSLIAKMTAKELKESIAASEGRVIMAQNFVGCQSLTFGSTNAELEAAFGADMILLNGYNCNPEIKNPGLQKQFWGGNDYFRLKDLKQMVGLPIGIYFECGQVLSGPGMEQYAAMVRDRLATRENLLRAIDEGASFVIIGGNPMTGTSMDTIIEGVRTAKSALGDQVMIMAGKWEDGYVEPVLGDPMNKRPSVDIIKDLIDAGADVITLPAPGSRTGITVDMIRECVEFVHKYKPGTLALDFLDGSIEGTDVDTIRQIGLMMKQTGADIHAIGDAGLSGCTLPENLFQLSITLKGRAHTYTRMTGRYR